MNAQYGVDYIYLTNRTTSGHIQYETNSIVHCSPTATNCMGKRTPMNENNGRSLLCGIYTLCLKMKTFTIQWLCARLRISKGVYFVTKRRVLNKWVEPLYIYEFTSIDRWTRASTFVKKRKKIIISIFGRIAFEIFAYCASRCKSFEILIFVFASECWSVIHWNSASTGVTPCGIHKQYCCAGEEKALVWNQREIKPIQFVKCWNFSRHLGWITIIQAIWCKDTLKIFHPRCRAMGEPVSAKEAKKSIVLRCRRHISSSLFLPFSQINNNNFSVPIRFDSIRIGVEISILSIFISKHCFVLSNSMR